MATSLGFDGKPAVGQKGCPKAADLCPTVDLALQAFDWLGALQFGPVDLPRL